MPMHDWTRVSAGTYHSFHNSWIANLQEALNRGTLPDPYYAMGEQRSGDFGPDILTLNSEPDSDEFEFDAVSSGPGDESGGTAVLTAEKAPPHVHLTQEAGKDVDFYLSKQRSLAIRHADGDRVIALIEIVSRANRHSLDALNDFADKVVAALKDGIHVLVIDPFPPGPHDRHGIHGFIWTRMLAGDYTAPEDRSLTMVAYCARKPIKAWIEPIAVGTTLIDMPIFLTREHYVNVPLEQTYQRSWDGVARRWQRVIEAE